MELVINHVVKFDHVHDTNGHTIIKWLTSASIIKNCLSITIHTCFTNGIPEIVCASSIKDRRCNMDTKVASSHTKVKFHNLTNIHTRWHPKWVQHDINWCPVWKIRHILNWNNAGNNPFVSVASGHFIPNTDFPFLSDVNTHQHVDTGLQFIAVRTSKDLHITDNTCTTVWYTKGGITYFTRFITENCMKQAFFSR